MSTQHPYRPQGDGVAELQQPTRHGSWWAAFVCFWRGHIQVAHGPTASTVIPGGPCGPGYRRNTNHLYMEVPVTCARCDWLLAYGVYAYLESQLSFLAREVGIAKPAIGIPPLSPVFIEQQRADR